MQLPIAATPSQPAADVLLRYYQHTTRLWTEHLSEPTLLECGTAYANPQLPAVREANRVLDAALPEGMSAAAAIDSVERHYAALGCPCASWTMNVSAGLSRTRPLIDQLTNNQFRSLRTAVMHLKRASLLSQRSAFQIIPARASFRHVRILAEEMSAHAQAPQLVDANVLHLDDPHWDSFLAFDGSRVVGTAGVLIAGNIGRIDELFVSERDRRRGVGIALIGRVLETCARSLLKHVLLGVAANHLGACPLFEKVGFERVGSEISYFDPPAMPLNADA